ncbi:MAG TPA: hypothetical protein VFE53_08970 [Mucilaginibacter sp.]|jgi:hypothetical protein|nr:hypothetical protein [Mucilaginibacter sp.]
MIKREVTRPRLFSLIFLPVILFFLFDFIRPHQQTGEIILHDERLGFTAKQFYIADVIDDRSDRRQVARLVSPGNSETQPGTNAVDFQGGFAAVKRFIENSFVQNSTLHPIIIHVKKFMVTETSTPNGLAEGRAELLMTFDLRQEFGTQHLLDYTGNANYTRTVGPAQDIEPTLRKMLSGGLDYFNAWINKQAGSDERLAKEVKVFFTDYNESPEGDTIYYSVKRPLTWDDFKGGIPNSRYAAEVSPGIGFNERAEIKEGIIRVNLQIKVSLPKSACWAKEGVRGDAYTLNHEQRHFDLAKIAGMHLIQKIKAENLPVGNYDGFINVDYLDAYRQMDTLQEKYDAETSHGLDRYAQAQWNERIDRELKELGVK